MSARNSSVATFLMSLQEMGISMFAMLVSTFLGMFENFQNKNQVSFSFSDLCLRYARVFTHCTSSHVQ